MEFNGLLGYAHDMVMHSALKLAESHRQEEIACGIWSVGDVMGHLASFKRLTAEVTGTFSGHTATPYLKLWLDNGPDRFGEDQVALRQGLSIEDNLADYRAAHAEMMAFLAQLPTGDLHRPGTLPWYGSQYALDDFLLYTDFGHQIEHGSQLALLAEKPALTVK